MELLIAAAFIQTDSQGLSSSGLKVSVDIDGLLGMPVSVANSRQGSDGGSVLSSHILSL